MVALERQDFHTLKLALIAAIGTFIYGYDSGIVTTTISMVTWTQYMGNPSSNYVGAVASVYSAAQAVGCLIQFLVADRCGRIRFLQLAAVILVAGIAIQASAEGMGMFIAGRAVAGFPTGAIYLTTTIYLVEISSASSRGLIAGCSGLSVGLGIMVASWIGFACKTAAIGELQWRLPIALQGLFAIGFLIATTTTWLTESPRHLLHRGEVVKASSALTRLGKHLDSLDMQKSFLSMRSAIEDERSRRLPVRRTAVAFVCGIMPSLTGSQVLGYYQVRLYQTLDIQLKHRLLLAGVYGTISFISVALTDKLVIDRWGRRNLMVFGLVGCVCVNIYNLLMTRRFQGSTNEVGKGFTVGGLYALTAFHYAAFGSAAGIYQAEILPVKFRSKVMGLTNFLSFALIAGLSEAAPSAFMTIRHNFYYVFIGSCFIFLVIAGLWFPETKQRELEDMGRLFEKVKNPDSQGYTRCGSV